jgi:hypothetical protein
MPASGWTGLDCRLQFLFTSMILRSLLIRQAVTDTILAEVEKGEDADGFSDPTGNLSFS